MKKPLIMGMGITGRSISSYLCNQSIHHIVMDSCPKNNANLSSYVDEFLTSEDTSILKEISKIFPETKNFFLSANKQERKDFSKICLKA